MKSEFPFAFGGLAFRLVFLLITIALLPETVLAEVLEFGSRNHPDFGQVYFQGVEKFRGADTTFDLRLRPHSYIADAHNKLYLDFNAPSPVLLKDTTGNFLIQEAHYAPTSDARKGSAAALFNHRGDRILIHSPEEVWPYTGRLGDFSIEMWLKPAHFSYKNSIFRKEALESGYKTGFEKGIGIYIQDRRINFLCQNLFESGSGHPHSIHLRSRTRLRLHRWIHVLVSFNSASGKLILFVNGREEKVAYAADGRGVWRASFSNLDRSPLTIGAGYSGIIDEFRITDRSVEEGEFANTLFDPRMKATSVNSPGVMTGRVTSAVHRLPGKTVSRRGRILYRAEEPVGSLLNFWVRTSLRPFHRSVSEKELPWKLVGKNQNALLPFSHIQWKVEMRPDPDGKTTPELHDIRLSYTPYVRPVPPRSIRVIGELSRDERVCLQWLRNPEGEVQGSGGGYYVYFGHRPGEYIGRLSARLQDGKTVPINMRDRKKLPLTRAEKRMQILRPHILLRNLTNKIRLCVTNDLIEKNSVIAREGGPYRNMPFLRNNRTYTFAVSAYYRIEGGMIMESPLSVETTTVLRPQAGLRDQRTENRTSVTTTPR